jgi:hypothetical protein
MKFLITRTSDPLHCEIKDFKTIEELIEFKETIQQEIIITDRFCYQTQTIYKIPYEIEIYDDYRE